MSAQDVEEKTTSNYRRLWNEAGSGCECLGTKYTPVPSCCPWGPSFTEVMQLLLKISLSTWKFHFTAYGAESSLFLFREEWVSCSSLRLNNLHAITNAAFSTGFLTWSLFLAEGDNSAHHYIGTSLSLWDTLCPIFQWVSNTILTYILGKIIKFPAPGLGTAPTHNSAWPGAEMRRPSTSQLITPRAFLLKM